MGLKDLYIGPADNSPEVILKAEGLFIIRGRGLIINKADFIDAVFVWVNTYIKNPAEMTRIILSFEYLNSYTLSFIVAFLNKLKSILKEDDVRLSVSWYLEEDDEDIMERGLHLSHVTDLPLKFIKVPDISEFNRAIPMF